MDVEAVTATLFTTALYYCSLLLLFTTLYYHYGLVLSHMPTPISLSPNLHRRWALSCARTRSLINVRGIGNPEP